MQYLELIEAVAIRTHLPAQTIRLVIETVAEIIVERLAEKEDVVWRHFGSFHMKSVYSPATKENVWAVRFKIADGLKNIVKKGKPPWKSTE